MYNTYVKQRLSRINTFLLVAIILINGYVALLPFAPNAFFLLQRHSAQRQTLQHSVHQPASSVAGASPSLAGNELTIPSMLLDQPINDGPTIATLRKGLWRLPYTSTPDKGSNTVIVGHRFTYTNPEGVLYHLDKVRVGDEIGVTWAGKKYIYSVTTVEQVKVTQISIEAPTSDARLTIYTCTPLWLPKDRLVVVAELEQTL